MTDSFGTPAPFTFGSPVWPGLAKVLEEGGELGEVIGKLIAMGGEVTHHDGSNLRERLHEEIADVQAALGFLVSHNDLDETRIAKRREAKGALFWRWHVEASCE